MSGIVGFVNLDGAPADRELLGKLTRAIAFRGPDRQSTGVFGQTGLGHTLLATTWTAQREVQPCTIDGNAWITADCRIDAREELIASLEAKGRTGLRSATDPELILHAWAEWGVACPEHLLGDFAFAIWDRQAGRLFCARDHMGVKPFYYAFVRGVLAFGNTLDDVRLHPAISDALNDLAIADYLLFSYNQDQATTTFADIQRLPPAHSLEWQGGELKIKRYWTRPIDEPLRLRREEDYVEQFLDLLRIVTRDRMRTDKIGILMSGGLDSTSMAAMAKELGERESVALSAHTLVFDRVIPDEERYYAGIAARHLGIPIRFYPGDDFAFFTAVRNGHRFPEPAFITYFGAPVANAEMTGIASEARVAFFGEGPDNALQYEWKPYFRHELRQGHLSTIGGEIARFAKFFGHLPMWKRREAQRRQKEKLPWVDAMPPWMNPEFVTRLGLKERCAGLGHGGAAQGTHPWHPGAYDSFTIPMWQWLFEWHDPGVTRLPLEVRNPFVDNRMARFLLSLPVIPWGRDKYLLRRAMQRFLPPEITARRKASLAGFPCFEEWKRTGLPANLPSLDGLERYIECHRLETIRTDGPALLDMKLRVLSLAFFLRDLSQPCIMGGT